MGDKPEKEQSGQGDKGGLAPAEGSWACYNNNMNINPSNAEKQSV
jgi:hypothetical protein